MIWAQFCSYPVDKFWLFAANCRLFPMEFFFILSPEKGVHNKAASTIAVVLQHFSLILSCFGNSSCIVSCLRLRLLLGLVLGLGLGLVDRHLTLDTDWMMKSFQRWWRPRWEQVLQLVIKNLRHLPESRREDKSFLIQNLLTARTPQNGARKTG